MKAKKPYPRSSRLGLMLQKEVSTALLTASNPLLNRIVISRVNLSESLATAKVWYEIMGLSSHPDEEKEIIKTQTADALDGAKGFIRSHVAKSVPTKKTPALQFQFDESLLEHFSVNDIKYS